MVTQSLKPLVVLDCDSTTIEEEVIELIAESAGTRAEVAAITEQAMRGEIDFAESLRARVRTLAGVSTEIFQEVADQVTLSPGYLELVQAAHERGGKVAVVSGGFIEVLDLFLPKTGTDVWHANKFEISDGSLTGDLVGEVVDAATKARKLVEWASVYGIDPSHSIAVGDGANDLEMMAVAGISVGFRPKPVVRKNADVVLESTLAGVISLFEKL